MVLAKEQVMNLSGSELDKLVATANGWGKTYFNDDDFGDGDDYWCCPKEDRRVCCVKDYHPTTNGTQCMEIMQRERIEVKSKDGHWFAKIDNEAMFSSATGETAMIAICRCFVASKLEVING